MLRDTTNQFSRRSGNLRSSVTASFWLFTLAIFLSCSLSLLWCDCCYLVWFILSLGWWSVGCWGGLMPLKHGVVGQSCSQGCSLPQPVPCCVKEPMLCWANGERIFPFPLRWNCLRGNLLLEKNGWGRTSSWFGFSIRVWKMPFVGRWANLLPGWRTNPAHVFWYRYIAREAHKEHCCSPCDTGVALGMIPAAVADSTP